MKDIRPIRTKDDLAWALSEIEQYFDHEPDPGTPDADRFDVLTALIKVYEDERWPIEAAHPVDVLLTFMEGKGLSQGDLATLLGSKSRASEILNRKRELSKDQAWAIHQGWGVPLDLISKPYAVAEVTLRPAAQAKRPAGRSAAKKPVARKASASKVSKKAVPAKKAARPRKAAVAKKPLVRRLARPSTPSKRPTVHS